jgi:hypothetical protein
LGNLTVKVTDNEDYPIHLICALPFLSLVADHTEYSWWSSTWDTGGTNPTNPWWLVSTTREIGKLAWSYLGPGLVREDVRGLAVWLAQLPLSEVV